MSELDFKDNNDLKFSLFAPRTKNSLTKDYPELKNNPALKDLEARKLLFAYFLGCKTSPYYEEYNSSDRHIKVKAVDKARRDSAYIIQDQRQYNDVFKQLNFPPEIRQAIQAFDLYEPSVRVRIKMMKEKMLENFEKIINVDVEGKEFEAVDKNGAATGERDYDKISKYVGACSNIEKLTDDILKALESGYGISSEGKEEAKSGEGISYIDAKHETN
jgi:hypothetical protein